jgi:hypothetical protein
MPQGAGLWGLARGSGLIAPCGVSRRRLEAGTVGGSVGEGYADGRAGALGTPPARPRLQPATGRNPMDDQAVLHITWIDITAATQAVSGAWLARMIRAGHIRFRFWDRDGGGPYSGTVEAWRSLTAPPVVRSRIIVRPGERVHRPVPQRVSVASRIEYAAEDIVALRPHLRGPLQLRESGPAASETPDGEVRPTPPKTPGSGRFISFRV